jgi:hypothetical protein
MALAAWLDRRPLDFDEHPLALDANLVTALDLSFPAIAQDSSEFLSIRFYKQISIASGNHVISAMSAVPPTADIARTFWDGDVPKAEVASVRVVALALENPPSSAQ